MIFLPWRAAPKVLAFLPLVLPCFPSRTPGEALLVPHFFSSPNTLCVLSRFQQRHISGEEDERFVFLITGKKEEEEDLPLSPRKKLWSERGEKVLRTLSECQIRFPSFPPFFWAASGRKKWGESL